MSDFRIFRGATSDKCQLEERKVHRAERKLPRAERNMLRAEHKMARAERKMLRAKRKMPRAQQKMPRAQRNMLRAEQKMARVSGRLPGDRRTGKQRHPARACAFGLNAKLGERGEDRPPLRPQCSSPRSPRPCHLSSPSPLRSPGALPSLDTQSRRLIQVGSLDRMSHPIR
jgi:hypothetical protein